MRVATWYFDFVSPFAYIGLYRLRELPADLEIEYRPILFAGLLKHWGQKGPAELPTKRRYTYRWSTWWAGSLGIPLRYPAAHPFNPLPYLRLALACDARPDAVRQIFDAVWATGNDASDPARLADLVASLGIKPEELQTTRVKDQLRANTEHAIQRGVFGVPTLEIDGELFWGADGTDFARAFLADPAVLESEAMQRLDALPAAAMRKEVQAAAP